MASIRRTRIPWRACFVLALLFSAQSAAAQSTFVVPIDRTGTPGTTTVTTIDPLTGEETQMLVDIGAFINPCNGDWVNVTGSSTVSISQTVDKFGTLKIDVETLSKGLGVGWKPFFERLSGANYVFSDRQTISFRIYSGEEFASDFSDKFALKGAKSTDNWVIRATFRIKVNAAGEVQVFLIKTNSDVCKG